MAASVDPLPVKSAHDSKPFPEILLSHHGSTASHSLASKDNSTPRGWLKDESCGLISSIMSAAHNAANMMKAKHGTPSTESVSALSETNDAKAKKLRLLGLTRHLGLVLSFTEGSSHSPPGTPEPASLSPSSVHFEPLHTSPIHTLSQGNLSLVHFERKEQPAKSVLDSAETPVNGGPLMTESNNSKLLVSGGPDLKVLRKKSISNGSIADSFSSEGTINTDGADSHTFNPSEFSSLDLDQILDSSSKLQVNPKKDKEFHITFKKIPANEHLLADFSCALSRDILVQGKMYLSPHYICFNSNILGWVTNFVVPIQEIIQLEKKSTAVLFPNGMVIRTLHQKYVFATFLSRDSTFTMITRVWHNALQDKSAENLLKSKRGLRRSKSVSRRSTTNDLAVAHVLYSDEILSNSEEDEVLLYSSEENDLTFMSRLSEQSKRPDLKRTKNSTVSYELGSESDDEAGSTDSAQNELPSPKYKKNGKLYKGFANPGPQSHAPTSFEHEKAGGETEILKHTFSAPLGVVYNLLYGPDNATFVRILEEGRNFDISKERITELNFLHKEREYSYTKPLNGPIGPKQTKCNITERLLKYDLSNYCEVEQVTNTPEVPLGNSFKIKTRLYLNWGPKSGTDITVYTSVEWSSKSWIKLAIEKGSLDGQKSSMKLLTDIVSEIIGSGGSGESKKRRGRTKSGSQTSKAPGQPQARPPPGTLSSQILGLLNHIGLSIPVQIPMVNDTITGGIVLFLASLLYSYVLTFLLGGKLSYLGGKTPTPVVMGVEGKYIVMPSLEIYLNNAEYRRQNEAQLWDWILTRTGAESSGSARGRANNEKYADENFKEMMRMTKKRIDAAFSNLM